MKSKKDKKRKVEETSEPAAKKAKVAQSDAEVTADWGNYTPHPELLAMSKADIDAHKKSVLMTIPDDFL